MTQARLIKKTPFPFFGASRPFWCCLVVGWIIYIYVESYIIYYYGGDYLWNIINLLLVSISTTLVLLCFRYFYFTLKWNHRSPIELVPISCFLAIIFAYFISFINAHLLFKVPVYDLLVGIFTKPHSYAWFPGVAGFYYHNIYLLLSLFFVYTFIQAERSGRPYKKPRAITIINSAAAILLTIQFLYACSIFTYYNVEGYLFSAWYFWSGLYLILFSLLFSFYIFLIKPREQLAKSRLLPLIPTILLLVFCSSIFCMWIFKLIPHMYDIIFSPSAADAVEKVKQIFSYQKPLWGRPDEFFGLLQAKFCEQLIIALYLLTFRFHSHWMKTENITPPPSIDLKKSFHFWIYNLAGWSLAGLYLYFSDLLEMEDAGKNIAKMYIIAFIMVGAFLGSVMRSIIKQHQLFAGNLISFTYKITGVSIAFGIIHACALTIICYLYAYPNLDATEIANIQDTISGGYQIYKTIAWFSLCFLVWSLIYEISISQRNKASNLLKNLQLEKSLKEIQLNTLSSKIDPHFIFNTLNNIRALINEDSEKAREAILVLSDILRNPLTKSTHDKVIINEEIALIRNYIMLSKIQLEERIHYEEHINEVVTTALIPPMMLQILVENAIKHGISQVPQGGGLSLNIYTENNNVVCKIINTGSLSKGASTAGFGVGLSNIKERLWLLYGQAASFRLIENISTDQVIAELILPLEYMP